MHWLAQIISRTFSEITVQANLEVEVHQGTIIVEAGPNDDIYIDGKRVGRRRFEGVLHWNGEQMLDWYVKSANVT